MSSVTPSMLEAVLQRYASTCDASVGM